METVSPSIYHMPICAVPLLYVAGDVGVLLLFLSAQTKNPTTQPLEEGPTRSWLQAGSA